MGAPPPEPAYRRIVREKLAELLKEPLERVSGNAQLRRFRRYHPQLVRELLKNLDLDVSAEELRSLERVQDLVNALANRASTRQRLAATRDDAASTADAVAPRGAGSGARESLLDAPAAVAAPGEAPPAPPGAFSSPSPYKQERIGAAAVYCSDGRVGDQVDDFLHQGLSWPRYDRVACPGGPVALAGRLTAFWECRGVEEQLRFLVRVHRLHDVVLIAHEGCAYYTERLGFKGALTEREQRKDLETAAWAVRRMDESLGIRAYFARRLEAHIRFDPVALQVRSRAETR
jgi:hypothetical protein